MNDRMQWFGLEGALKDHPVPGQGQGHHPLDEVAQNPTQPGLEHFQRWEKYLFLEEKMAGGKAPRLVGKIMSKVCKVLGGKKKMCSVKEPRFTSSVSLILLENY